MPNGNQSEIRGEQNAALAGSVWDRLFGIDVRSLAAFRIAIGLLVLGDLLIRSSALALHYTDAGILPQSARSETYLWSLHALNGTWLFEAALFVVAALAAVGLVIGFRTWGMLVLTWFLCVSVQNRNVLINNAGDVLLVVLLFWALFLPLDARWCVDRRLRPEGGERTLRHCSAASTAILVQLALMYLFSGLFKLNDVWLSGTAMQNALNDHVMARPLGETMLKHPQLLQAVSIATPWLEIALPIFCFVPWRTGRLRYFAILAAALFHFSVELILVTGLFPFASMIGWILFLPTPFWDKLRRLGNRGAIQTAANSKLFADASAGPSRAATATVGSPKATSLVREAILVSLLIYVIGFNVDMYLRSLNRRPIMPEPLRKLGSAARLSQSWNMFSKPNPRPGWFVITGTLEDGRKADLLAGRLDPMDARHTQPTPGTSQFSNFRWREFYSKILMPETSSKHRAGLAKALCREWNDLHGLEAQITSVEIEFLVEVNDPAQSRRALGRWLHHIEDCRALKQQM